jgi:hypothetical protein
MSAGLPPRLTAAEYRARAAVAAARARAVVTSETWTSDPGLCVPVDMILAMSPDERVRQIEAETAVFVGAPPLGVAETVQCRRSSDYLRCSGSWPSIRCAT